MAGSLGRFILQFLKEVQEVGNNWYKSTAEWKEFPRQVEQLKEKLEFWESECSNIGVSSNVALNRSLQDVKSLLEEEVENLKKRTGSCWSGCWPRLGTTLFPAKLGLSIQGAINAFNNIPEMLRSNEETVVALAKTVQASPFPEPITPDSRYVPLEDSEMKVYKALDNPEGPPVVLLHGGPGKGKSTLARSTALYYNKSDQPRFNHVFFLSCGPQARAEDTQFELVQRLGFEPSSSPQDTENTRALRIRKQVRGLLSVQKVLIILDDVTDKEFLAEIVGLCGHRVKCLVTSQEANLCRALDRSKFLKIQIQDIELEDARKILASHVGLPNQQIPANLQEVADSMIRETDCNPLALASLANGIDCDRSDELVEWEEASRNFFKALHFEVPALFHGKLYPRSFWLTTDLCINSITEASRKLLLLIHACEGPSVPEEVIKVLYSGLAMQGDPVMFSIVRNELHSRQLIKVTASSSNLDKKRKWSVHSLLKLYIDKKMAGAGDFIVASLANKDNMDLEHQIVSGTGEVKRSTVLMALCALYLDKVHASRAQTKLCIPLQNFSNVRRNAIEPITLLLGHPLSIRWTETEHLCVAKVFLKYICDGILDDLSISHLLGSEIAAPAMCGALRDITFIEERCLVNENTQGLMTLFVSWLTEQLKTCKQKAAIEVLAGLAYNRLHCKFMVSFPGVLEGIIRVLHNDSSNLDPFHDSTLTSEIENSLSQEVIASLDLQATAALAMSNLACGGLESGSIIVNHQGVIPSLVNSLSKVGNPALQVKAALALANLTLGADEIRIKISNHQGLLPELVRSLSGEVNVNLQENCTRALSNLARVEDNITRMKATEGIIGGLVRLLSEDSEPRTTQTDAALTLTLLEPEQGNGYQLLSPFAYYGRARANFQLRLFEKALVDFNKAYQEGHGPIVGMDQLRIIRCVVKAKMGDFQGALVEANGALDNDCTFNRGHYLQERGVLKIMMGDHRGALEDLNNGLAINIDDYERLKHRGYVKFLLKDEEGARADAERAQSVRPLRVDYSGLGIRFPCLGESSVQYLGYMLR